VPGRGTATGQPLPRFAALRRDEANMRRGPDLRYPVEWIYRRADLPVEIVREFENWRLVRDPDGVMGWIIGGQLQGRRSFIVRGEERVMRRRAEEGAAAVARLKPGVIGRIRSCEAEAEWCQVQVGDLRGWLRRADFWGTYAGEAVN
jgi:SH3-like domain-containing protein